MPAERVEPTRRELLSAKPWPGCPLCGTTLRLFDKSKFRIAGPTFARKRLVGTYCNCGVGAWVGLSRINRMPFVCMFKSNKPLLVKVAR